MSDPTKPTPIERAQWSTRWHDYVLSLKAFEMGRRRDKPEKPPLPDWLKQDDKKPAVTLGGWII